MSADASRRDGASERDALAPAERAAWGGSLRPGLSVAPFVAIVVAAQLIAIGTPGGVGVLDLALSVALLCAGLALLVLRRFREWAFGPLVILMLYVSSVVTLQLAEGGEGAGSGALLLVPLVAAALFFGARESIAVIVAVLVATTWRAVGEDRASVLIVRHGVFWIAVAGLVAVAIHALRAHLRRSVVEARRLLNQAQTLEVAARELTSLNDEGAIVMAGIRLAALVVAPAGAGSETARYERVGEGGEAAVAGNEQRADPRSRLGPDDGSDGRAREARVAVFPGGSLHGYLVVECDHPVIGQVARDGLAALAQIMELSLSNLFAHRRLEDQAMQEERRRIARELHDGLAHELAFIAARARSCERHPETLDAAELARSADRALDEARRAITVLSAPTPQRLRDGIAQTAEDLGSRYGIPIDLDLQDDVDVGAAQAEHLLRIVREAISNAARHGHPTRLTIHLWEDHGHHLVVADDGVGFELDRAPRGFGLTSMRERAEAVGGALSLRSAVNEGTRVEVHIP